MLAVSWIAAVVACLGYGVASVLQSVGARRVAAAAGLTGIARIIRQVPYLLGLGADTIAFAGNVVALQQLPLFLVQSVVAASVGVTAVIASLRGARLSGRDWGSLGVLGLGLVLLAVTAAPAAADQISVATRWLVLALGVLPLAVGLVGMRLTGRAAAIVLSVSAGLGFTGVAVASRGVGADPMSWALLANPLVYAILGHGAIAIAFFGVALQRGAVTTVTAITFVIEVIAPSLIGMVLFGDAIEPRFTALAVLGFVLAIAGTVSLSRFAE